MKYKRPSHQPLVCLNQIITYPLLGNYQILRAFAGGSVASPSNAPGSDGGGAANSAAEVLLVSLKSCGVGMNLTAAS